MQDKNPVLRVEVYDPVNSNYFFSNENDFKTYDLFEDMEIIEFEFDSNGNSINASPDNERVSTGEGFFILLSLSAGYLLLNSIRRKRIT